MKTTLKVLAISLAVLLLTAAIMIVFPLSEAPDESIAGNFIIKDVNIVDVEAGRIVAGQDVTIRDGRVSKIEKTSKATPNTSLNIINGRSKYIMPGLWDMHTHSFKISPQFHHPLFIANGVTGVRDMSGCMSELDSFWACIDDRERWNRNTKDDRGVSPRYVLQSSYQMNGGNEVPAGFPEYFRANDIEKNDELVVHYVAAGADFLKTYSELSPEAYKNLAKKAQERGLTIAGHRPLRISLSEAIEAKQQSIEHPRLFLLECFDGAQKFRELPDPIAAYDTDIRRQLVDDHDSTRCKTMMQEMSASTTYWTPTLQVLQMSARAGDSGFRKDPRLKYIPFILNEGMWQGDADQSANRAMDKKGRNIDVEMYQLAKKNLVQAHEIGVKLLAGTDAGDSYVFPGFSIHQELEQYVEAGISPENALRIATIEAALFSKLDQEYGSIKVGKVADILMLRSNPFVDIRNTQKIDGLFLGGRYFDRPALDGILDFAEQQARSIRLNLRFLWNALSSPLMRVQLAD